MGAKKLLFLGLVKSLILVCFLCLFVSQIAYAQDKPLEKYLSKREGVKYPNILKINTLAVPFQNIAISYERALKPRLSIELSAGYRYGGSEPGLFNIENALIQYEMDEFTGFTFTPELRYYVKTCDARFLEGLYLGLYFRYSYLENSAYFEYFPKTLNIEYYNADLEISEVGGGIVLGYQVMILERLSIDFLFFGPRWSNYHLGYQFNETVSQEFLDDLSEAMNEMIDQFGLDYNVDLNQTGETYASHTFSFVNMRFGLSLGFAF